MSHLRYAYMQIFVDFNLSYTHIYTYLHILPLSHTHSLLYTHSLYLILFSSLYLDNALNIPELIAGWSNLLG